MEIPEVYPEAVLSPFFAWWMAAGAAAFFYILFFTDLLPKPDMENPREKAFMVFMLIGAVIALIYFLVIQIQGGVTNRWFPW